MKKAGIIFFILATIILTLNIFTNFLGVANDDWFESFETVSDDLVLGKAHCSIHTHILYVLWSLPCTILIFAAFGFIIDGFFGDLIFKKAKIEKN